MRIKSNKAEWPDLLTYFASSTTREQMRERGLYVTDLDPKKYAVTLAFDKPDDHSPLSPG